MFALSVLAASIWATALNIVWMGVLVCSLLIVVAVTLGLFAKRAKYWRIVVGLAAADLLLGATAALLDQFGFGR